MANRGFYCADGYLKRTAKLTDEEVGRLFRACMIYHATGEIVELEGRESVAFDFIREDIDAANEAYAAKCETNRRNRLGTATDEALQPTTNDNERGRTISTVNERGRTSTNVHESAKEKEKEKEEDKEKDKGIEIRRFTPPTLDEVRAYCKERNNKVDYERFVDFYTSKGWKVGNQPMKDWKAAVRTWERNGSQSSQPVKQVIAQQYTQRDYTEKEDSMDDVLNRIGRAGA